MFTILCIFRDSLLFSKILKMSAHEDTDSIHAEHQESPISFDFDIKCENVEAIKQEIKIENDTVPLVNIDECVIFDNNINIENDESVERKIKTEKDDTNVKVNMPTTHFKNEKEALVEQETKTENGSYNRHR